MSINLNKRIRTLKESPEFGSWLREREIDILLIQEPCRNKDQLPSSVFEYILIEGNEKTATYSKRTTHVSHTEHIFPYLQRIEISYLVFYNVYMDAYKQGNRAEQLIQMLQQVKTEQDKPIILTGDFNLAPNESDGLYGGKPSSFNSKKDRDPFFQLLNEGNLIDVIPNNKDIPFTVHKTRLDKEILFRCDLALVSDYYEPHITLEYDHDVRTEPLKFTDHSALLFRLPITVSEEELFHDEHSYFPYKTAMSRKGPSSIAKSVISRLSDPLGIESILDYGCGRGADVAYYKENGYVVEGYDNHSPFGFSNKPNGKFDLITINYVLNVLANPYERYLVLKEASQYLKENGYMLVTARSVFEIEKEAQSKNWPIHSDGYWSSVSKRTFQKGITETEIINYAKKLNLSVHPLTKTLKYAKNTSHVLFKQESMI